VSRASFNDVSALRKARQLLFQFRAGFAVTGTLPQQLLERGPALRQLTDVL
jgi:hypothetical protein